MREISVSAAIRETLTHILRESPETILIGEDIGLYGGAFKITRGFIEEFGAERIVETPICEGGFVSIACGAALMGSRPIVEIMFMDFLTLAMDALINVAGKWRDVYGADFAVPLVIRTPAGAGRSYGPTHSQSFEGLLLNVPGLNICCPSTPADAAGMLRGVWASNTPSIFVEHKSLYARKGPCPKDPDVVPPGAGRRRRSGGDVSLFCYGRHVPVCLQAARQLEAEGIQADVIDLRSLKPLDTTLIVDSLAATGRGISVEESPVTGGIGGELAAVAMEQAFDYLEAPFTRLGAAEHPVHCSPPLERAGFPDAAAVAAAARHLAEY